MLTEFLHYSLPIMLLIWKINTILESVIGADETSHMPYQLFILHTNRGGAMKTVLPATVTHSCCVLLWQVHARELIHNISGDL